MPWSVHGAAGAVLRAVEVVGAVAVVAALLGALALAAAWWAASLDTDDRPATGSMLVAGRW